MNKLDVVGEDTVVEQDECAYMDSLIGQYVLAGLKPEEVAVLAEHVSSCETCRAVLAGTQLVIDRIVGE